MALQRHRWPRRRMAASARHERLEYRILAMMRYCSDAGRRCRTERAMRSTHLALLALLVAGFAVGTGDVAAQTADTPSRPDQGPEMQVPSTPDTPGRAAPGTAPAYRTPEWLTGQPHQSQGVIKPPEDI